MTWTCKFCKESDNVDVDLQQVDDEMVCPLCARVDAHASSVVRHVDVNEVTGMIVDDVSTHQAIDKSRMYSGDWNERRYIVGLSSSCIKKRRSVFTTIAGKLMDRAETRRRADQAQSSRNLRAHQLQSRKWFTTMARPDPESRPRGPGSETNVFECGIQAIALLRAVGGQDGSHGK